MLLLLATQVYHQYVTIAKEHGWIFKKPFKIGILCKRTCFFTSVKLFGVRLCQDLLRERSWLQKDCCVLCTCLEGCVITYSIMSVTKKQEWLKFRPTNIPYSNEGTGKLSTSFRTEHPASLSRILHFYKSVFKQMHVPSLSKSI